MPLPRIILAEPCGFGAGVGRAPAWGEAALALNGIPLGGSREVRHTGQVTEPLGRRGIGARAAARIGAVGGLRAFTLRQFRSLDSTAGASTAAGFVREAANGTAGIGQAQMMTLHIRHEANSTPSPPRAGNDHD